ncbi:MAG: hypothetical protein FP816_15770 [Desulfobacteraceae bacterium]|nr:hypothetical protein [Desulfobacteraceae bacterium]MBU3948979.1 hypothetical protein [Pseudomonadota bacterium]
MSITTFQGFLATANLHQGLLVDLCAEPGVISRAKLLTYMERHGISPADKDRLIERYCRTSILYEEADFEYSVNPVVVGLVNFYERRGRLTHAGFLRDQIFEIGKLTDTLQQLLFAELPEMDGIIDTVDKIYLVVREVRESGYQHYQACMRAFGDMKRNSGERPIDVRIEELKTVHRRYIEPLRELIDPNAEPVRKMALLRRRMADLGVDAGLLSESVELDIRRARLAIDIQYIDHVLIRHFETLIDTSRALLNSLLEEKSIKDALAACLGDLGGIWENLTADTIVLTGFQASQTAGMDRQGAFFNDVIHGKFIPRPRPLSITLPKEERADHLLLFDDLLLSRMEKDRRIDSWPGFVIREYVAYPPDERLKAIALPLIMANPPFVVRMSEQTFSGDLKEYTVELTDFDIVWEGDNGR